MSETLESQPKIAVNIIDINNPEVWKKVSPQLLELENIAWRPNNPLDLEGLEKLVKGAIVGVIYGKDNKIIGSVMTRLKAEPESPHPILKNLPTESLNADGTAVHPDSRGQGLQKILLESREELAKKFDKKTILSCVRPENGASLRNIIASGARIIGYDPNYFPGSTDPARLIWETDIEFPTQPDEKVEKKDSEHPDKVVWVKSAEYDVDVDAQKEIADLLSKDYVGIAVQTSERDEKGIPLSSGIVFRHLSNFSPEVKKRLEERKEVVKGVLKDSQEKLNVDIAFARPEDWENYKKIIIEAFINNPQAFSQMQLDNARGTTDEQWREIFKSDENSFAVLAKVNGETIGTTGARKTKKEGVWFGLSLYLSDKFKIDRFSTILKMFKLVEEELKKRGAKKVILYLKEGEGRDRIKSLYERFGFKVNNDPENHSDGYVYMERAII